MEQTTNNYEQTKSLMTEITDLTRNLIKMEAHIKHHKQAIMDIQEILEKINERLINIENQLKPN